MNEEELKKEIDKRNLAHRKEGERLNVVLSDGGWDDTIELEASLKTLQERNAEVKHVVENCYNDIGEWIGSSKEEFLQELGFANEDNKEVKDEN